MDLPLADLSRFDATLQETADGFSITTASGKVRGVFPHPADPTAFIAKDSNKVPATSLTTQWAIRALVEFDHAATILERNPRLSQFGRAEKLAQPREAALKTLLATHNTLAAHAKTLEQQEAQHYAVPALAAGDVIAAMHDTEIRQYLRSMSEAERQAAIAALRQGEDSALVRAVLRSPVKMGNLELYASNGWRARIDRDDPETRELLDIGKKSVGWAQRSIGIAQSMLMSELRLTPEQIFDLVGDAGAGYFGIEPADLLHIKRMRAARASA